MRFWCATAFMDTREVLAVAPLLDEAGYHGLMVSDHLVYPRDLQSRYPYSPHPDGRPIWEPETSWPDPWVLIGAMAAVTEQLRFTTNIYVAPHRPLLQLAKEVATAAVLSENRVALGAGAGWMKEEFDLQGQDYESRGRRLNEMIPALRALWQGGWVEHHGEHYDIPAVMMEPHPSEPVPIYGGGHTDAALRRAARLCDGWIGNAYGWDDAAHHVGRLKGFLDEYGRSGDDFEIICGLYAMPEPDLFRRAEEELGITGTLCVPWALDRDVAAPPPEGTRRSPEVYRPSIERFAADVLAHCQP
jgi:probable F420-dependent oxidoreductase